jgi:D-alanyl-lipoteichoic acid acyltransferase DltB (MBOAT superfamily)
MLLGGLWHGAAWTFVIWGMYHGLLLIGYRMCAPRLGENEGELLTRAVQRTKAVLATAAEAAFGLQRMEFVPLNSANQVQEEPMERRSWFWPVLKYGLCVLLMFHLTCMGWLLFRARNMTTVGLFLQGIFMRPHWSAEAVTIAKNLVYYGWFLILFQVAQVVSTTLNPMARWPWFVRLNVWLYIIMSLLALASSGKQEFIYFAF